VVNASLRPYFSTIDLTDDMYGCNLTLVPQPDDFLRITIPATNDFLIASLLADGLGIEATVSAWNEQRIVKQWKFPVQLSNRSVGLASVCGAYHTDNDLTVDKPFSCTSPFTRADVTYQTTTPTAFYVNFRPYNGAWMTAQQLFGGVNLGPAIGTTNAYSGASVVISLLAFVFCMIAAVLMTLWVAYVKKGRFDASQRYTQLGDQELQ